MRLQQKFLNLLMRQAKFFLRLLQLIITQDINKTIQQFIVLFLSCVIVYFKIHPIYNFF